MEPRSRAILESMYGFVGVCALDGTLVDVNRAPLEVMGLPRDQVIGVAIWDLLAFSYSPLVQEQTRDALLRAAKGENIRYEAPVRIKDGGMITIDVMFAPLRDATDTIERVLAFAVDITERKVAEQTLQKSEERYRAIVEDQSDLVVRWDADAKVTFVNEAVSRFWKLRRDELVGRSILHNIPTEHLTAFYAYLATLTRESPVKTIELQVHVDGKARWIQWTTSAIFDSEGQLVEIQSVGRDTTERRQLEEALKLTQFSIDRASDAVYWVSPAAEILNVNEAACATLGYERSELIGRAIGDVDPNFNADTWPDRWNELEDQHAVSFESAQRCKDGSVIDTEVTANFIEYGGRKLSCAIVRDITERKRAERMLQMMQLSVDLAAESVLWLAPNGRVIYANNAIGRLLGHSHDELLKCCISDFDTQLPGESWARHWPFVRQLGSLVYESTYRSQTGQLIPVEINSNYVRFGDKEFNVVF